MEMGFIGLGGMGEPMARNLIKAGHALKIYNRTRSRAEALVSHGATSAETPAAAYTAGVVATILADDAAVEGVVFGEHGVDPATFLETMVGSFFQSPIYENYGKIIGEQRYEPAGFKLRLGLKDVRLVLAAADEAASPMPIASVIRDIMISGIAQGLGDWDWSAVARVAALNSGLKT